MGLRTSTKMKFSLLTFCVALSLCVVGGHYNNNNGCECDSLTVAGRYGSVEGNCQSTYRGSYWCYLPKNRYSSCTDKRHSTRVRGRQWSVQACSSSPETTKSVTTDVNVTASHTEMTMEGFKETAKAWTKQDPPGATFPSTGLTAALTLDTK